MPLLYFPPQQASVQQRSSSPPPYTPPAPVSSSDPVPSVMGGAALSPASSVSVSPHASPVPSPGLSPRSWSHLGWAEVPSLPTALERTIKVTKGTEQLGQCWEIRACFQYKRRFPSIGIPVITIRQSWDHFIFMMEILGCFKEWFFLIALCPIFSYTGSDPKRTHEKYETVWYAFDPPPSLIQNFTVFDLSIS